jgi:hypothetical protein
MAGMSVSESKDGFVKDKGFSTAVNEPEVQRQEYAKRFRGQSRTKKS